MNDEFRSFLVWSRVNREYLLQEFGRASLKRPDLYLSNVNIRKILMVLHQHTTFNPNFIPEADDIIEYYLMMEDGLEKRPAVIRPSRFGNTGKPTLLRQGSEWDRFMTYLYGLTKYDPIGRYEAKKRKKLADKLDKLRGKQ